YLAINPATPRNEAAERYSPDTAAAFHRGPTLREATRKSEVVRAQRTPYTPRVTVATAAASSAATVSPDEFTAAPPCPGRRGSRRPGGCTRPRPVPIRTGGVRAPSPDHRPPATGGAPAWPAQHTPRTEAPLPNPGAIHRREVIRPARRGRRRLSWFRAPSSIPGEFEEVVLVAFGEPHIDPAGQPQQRIRRPTQQQPRQPDPEHHRLGDRG